jgi:hypothetical protein
MFRNAIEQRVVGMIAIVYRDVYRGLTTSSASDGVSSQNFSFTAPPRGTPNLTCLPPDVLSFARANH